MAELMLICVIADRPVALPTARVKSVIDMGAITPVPGAKPHVLGLSALRSQALTVIDCRLALGFPPHKDPANARAVVTVMDDHAYALLVDEASVVSMPTVEPTGLTGGFGDEWRDVAQGMIETEQGPSLLIDLEKMIEGPLEATA